MNAATCCGLAQARTCTHMHTHSLEAPRAEEDAQRQRALIVHGNTADRSEPETQMMSQQTGAAVCTDLRGRLQRSLGRGRRRTRPIFGRLCSCPRLQSPRPTRANPRGSCTPPRVRRRGMIRLQGTVGCGAQRARHCRPGAGGPHLPRGLDASLRSPPSAGCASAPCQPRHGERA
jgi:hypothetical protein